MLADTQILYGLYKKYHWIIGGATFCPLNLLLDKHAADQLAFVDTLAERVQTLGGVAVGDPRHVAEITSVPRPPDGVKELPAMLSRLLEAHETMLAYAHDAAARAAELGDDGTNDLLISPVVRAGELQPGSWSTRRSSAPEPARPGRARRPRPRAEPGPGDLKCPSL
ncbi:Dps family protein [Streptomyces actuosus]|uniref:Dps family protein n=1 Tax=Streptomyces TaxID=1883 RepID=UPI003D2C6B5E